MVEDLEARVLRALVNLVNMSKGRRITVKARSLLKRSGADLKHRNILKVARVLNKLAEGGLVRVEAKNRLRRSRVLRYSITESMELWKMAKENPERTVKMLLERVLKLGGDLPINPKANAHGLGTMNNPPTAPPTPKGNRNNNLNT